MGAWLADPLRFFVTTTNLRGVPYRLRLSGAAGAGHDMVQHADHVRFALQTGSGSASAEVRPDEIALPPIPSEEPGQWALLLEPGLASGAFPLVLAPVPLARPGSDYNARVFVPGKGADVPPRFVPPAWRDPREADDYRFLAVDGGVTRNEPLELTHAVLAGALGQNPPRESETRRALILVAPLSETPELGPADDRGVTLASLSAALVRALLMTTRFDAQTSRSRRTRRSTAVS